MKAAAGISALLFLTFGASAQHVTRTFGSVVFPGGTSATTPGVTRTFGSVVSPGSTGVPVVHTTPSIVGIQRNTFHPITSVGQNFQNFRHNNGNGNRGQRTNSIVYAYPVFVGGYDSSLMGSEPMAPAPPPVQMPPMAMYSSYPPETPRPGMIQVAPPDYPRGPVGAYQPRTAADEPPAQETEHYLLAFKDHTVYSAVAYWFDGDTLHYFTTGSTHNQASVSLLDRELTMRLNKELGIDFHIPEPKK